MKFLFAFFVILLSNNKFSVCYQVTLLVVWQLISKTTFRQLPDDVSRNQLAALAGLADCIDSSELFKLVFF